MLRVREYGGPDKGTRVNFEIKRKFTRALDFDSEQFIKSAWTGVMMYGRRIISINDRI